MNDSTDAEVLFRRAMDSAGEWYLTRVAFAWDQLSITEGREQIIPVEDLVHRLSSILGRTINREQFLANCHDQPEDPEVVDGMARVLGVDPLWLRAESAPTD